jgi:putative flippase GtrA
VASRETPRSLRSSAVRFVLAGGLNTLVTGVALSFLARVIDPRVAYTIVFIAGIALAVALAGGFVFGVRMTPRLTALYVAMYLVVYAIGLLVVALAAAAGLPDYGSGLVVLVTAPLTFIGGRVLLTRRSAASGEALERTGP